jgi:hypothetical protein
VEQPLICDRANSDRKRDAQHREHANLRRRRRRRQVAPVVVFDIDELDWRRGRRRPEIVECVDRLLIIDKLVRRRRRKIHKGLGLEIRRRLELGREHREAAARVGDMRSFRIGPQIRPIRSRRIVAHRTAPVSGFAPYRENGAHPPRLVRVRIGGKELAIALDRVPLQRSGVSVSDRETGDGPALSLGQRRSRRRRVGGAFEDVERTV